MAAGANPQPGKPETAQRTPDLDALLAKLAFDPGDPASVQAALRTMDAAIDAKVAPYGLNPGVQDMANARKAVYRSVILERSRTHT